MSVIGNWRNGYGSNLNIQSNDPDGGLRGLYGSETGSAGVFLANGFAPPTLGSSENEPIALCVLWKPLGDAKEDPSCHWVSAMCGVVYHDAPEAKNGRPLIQALHGLIVSKPAQAALRCGVYAETLTFQKLDDCSLEEDGFAESSLVPQGAASMWLTLVNGDPASRFTRMTLVCASNGQVEGVVDVEGRAVPALGFLDPARTESRRSLALAMLIEGPVPRAVTLSGLIDTEKGTALLEQFEAQPTAFEWRYTAVTLGQETFAITAYN